MTSPTRSELAEHDIETDDTLVFLHIPKSGGITLGTLIDPLWSPGARCPEYLTLPLARLPREQIAAFRSFSGHFNYSALAQLLPPGFQTITMLREPLNRHVSFLRMVKRLGVYAADQSFLPALLQIGNPILMQIFQIANREGGQEVMRAWRENPLEALIEDEKLQKALGMINGQTRQTSPLRLVGRGLPNRPGLSEQEVENALLESACENLNSMLCFGLTERFQDSLHMLSYVFGWRPIPNSLRLNEAPEKLPADLLPASSLERLAGYNELDLKLYDFARALFEQRFARMTEDLLTRYGDATHARLAPPLAPDAIESLLDRHYRARLLARTPPPASSRFTFDQTVRGGFGWQRREVSPAQAPFRWTGPGVETSLDLTPLNGGDLQLRIGVFDSMSPDLLDELKITVNGQVCPWRRSSGEIGETVFQIAVPRNVIAMQPFLRVGLITQRTLSPQALDPQNPDSRQLGVAVHWIEQTAL